jgi:hypothetical protein
MITLATVKLETGQNVATNLSQQSLDLVEYRKNMVPSLGDGVPSQLSWFSSISKRLPDSPNLIGTQTIPP